jgi:hypothetical protein
MTNYLRTVLRTTPAAVFTAGDFVEGLAFMDAGWRRAVLFGMEQRLSCNAVIELTHARVAAMELTELSRAIVQQQPRHIRLNYLFWHTLDSGMVLPLIGLEAMLQGAFGGMSWDDLAHAYRNMPWVDFELEHDHFMMTARELGLL